MKSHIVPDTTTIVDLQKAIYSPEPFKYLYLNGKIKKGDEKMSSRMEKDRGLNFFGMKKDKLVKFVVIYQGEICQLEEIVDELELELSKHSENIEKLKSKIRRQDIIIDKIIGFKDEK